MEGGCTGLWDFYLRVPRVLSRTVVLEKPFYLCVSKQGPALYAYNDAKFTAEDWKGIRLVSDSIKVKDPLKVGRFGLGFKSVFHLTGMQFSSLS